MSQSPEFGLAQDPSPLAFSSSRSLSNYHTNSFSSTGKRQQSSSTRHCIQIETVSSFSQCLMAGRLCPIILPPQRPHIYTSSRPLEYSEIISELLLALLETRILAYSLFLALPLTFTHKVHFRVLSQSVFRSTDLLLTVYYRLLASPHLRCCFLR